MTDNIDMPRREAAIIRFLKNGENIGPDGATIRTIWESLHGSEWLGDNISLQAYHRIINKMVSRGKLIESGDGGDGSRRYTVTEFLMPENALTLSDIEENLWAMSASEALARYMDALDYFEDKQRDVLPKVAKALLDENPIDIILRMLKDKVDRLIETIEDYKDPETRHPSVENELIRRYEELVTLVHSYYGISSLIIDLGDINKIKSGQHIINPNWHRVASILQKRVFGDHILNYQDIKSGQCGGPVEQKKIIIGGSDGSTHAGYVHIVPGAAFLEDAGQLILTFNNSLGHVELPDSMASGFDFPYHGVPMTRAALEDPTNRGMILARPWYPNMDDSVYEHMKKSALDVVQFRVDERILLGTARALGNDRTKGAGKLLPRPHVHFRDGTVVPQEREFNHYCRLDEYGEMVREGIALSYSILRTIKDSYHVIFAGTVKSSQLKAFSAMLNWYISRGSARRLGTPIDPFWDISRAGFINDNYAMTKLLTALGNLPNKCLYTFAILRPYPQLLTQFYREKVDDGNWVERFQKIKENRMKDRDQWGGSNDYLSQVDVDDDSFVRMCKEADYVMFYIGHSGGNPAPGLPRYEFLDSLRNLATLKAKSRVNEKIATIIEAVSITGISLDADHNIMTNKKIIRLVPKVVYDAHEKCKEWGHKLESELKSAIVARLAELKRMRGVPTGTLEVTPMPIKEYLIKMQKALKGNDKTDLPKLPEANPDNKDDEDVE